MMDNRFHDFFLLRRPALPLNSILDFNQYVDANPQHFEHAILSLFAQSEFQDAIALASVDLHASLTKILSGSYQGDIRPICKALYRYLVRMSSRPTPFGTMAGVCSGEISGRPTYISFSQSAHIQPKAQLSFCALTKLSHAIASNPDVFPFLNLSLNTSLYHYQNVYRYISRSGSNNDSFSQHEVESNHYLDHIIALTSSPKTVSYLRGSLIEQGLSSPDADLLISTLYNEQILISELQAGPICENGLDDLIKRLDKLDHVTYITQDLRSIKNILNSSKGMHAISEKLRTILKKYYRPESDHQILLVNSVLKETSCNISQAPIFIVQKELDELMVLSQKPVNHELQHFCDAFFTKFQNRPVPLLGALDPRTGIGYGNNSVSDPFEFEHIRTLDLNSSNPRIDENRQLDGLRLALYEQSILHQYSSVTLSRKDLSQFEREEPHPSDGTYIMGKFITHSQTDLDSGSFKFSLGAMGSASSFNLMSRFCSADPVLKGLVTQAISREELRNADVLYAEINHVPSDKEGNILIRPHLRKHEIPYLAASKTKSDDQILPEDLYLYTPDGKRLILWSKSRAKKVIPRLTSAHNYVHGLPLYRLLCDLAQQYAARVFNWHWGQLSDKDFLPRIQYKHIILSQAQWNLSVDMLLPSQRHAPGYDDIKVLFKKMQLPRYTQIADSDQLLLIDSDSPTSMDMLLSLLRKRSRVKLVEFLELPDKGFLLESGQTYTHEVIIPFKGSTGKMAFTKPVVKTDKLQRIFAVGSEWIYIKIYLSPSLTDLLLLENIAPLCYQLLKEGSIDKWFFVRYDDPEHHLRLRLLVPGSKQKIFEILRTVCDTLQLLLNRYTIEKFKIDTYQRELERYHQLDYNLTETLFYKDSVSVCHLLELANSKLIPKWQIAIRAVNGYLDSLGYNLERKRILAGQIHKSFCIELNPQPSHIYEMDKTYRTYQTAICHLLEDGRHNDDVIEKLDQYLKPSFVQSQSISQQLTNPDTYVASFIHMFLNRLFSDNHRKMEFVIYHYLKKYYNTVYLKSKNAGKHLKNSASQL
jgi:thiopeptide-type bacteriocin biosynthesis protein